MEMIKFNEYMIYQLFIIFNSDLLNNYINNKYYYIKN